jgi:hypothetical protein
VNTRILLVGVLWGAGSLAAEDDGLHWIDNYPEAVREAKKSGKPIFLEYRCEP